VGVVVGIRGGDRSSARKGEVPVMAERLPSVGGEVDARRSIDGCVSKWAGMPGRVAVSHDAR